MISILLPTKTRVDMFPSAYASLIFELKDCDEMCEIIVINDNEVGENPQVDKMMTNLSVLTSRGPSAGSVQAFMCAVDLAKGDKLLFVNDDMVFYQPFINPMLRDYANGYSIVGSKLLYENMTVQHAGMEFLPEHDWVSNHRFRYYPHDAPEVNEFKEMPCVTFSLTLVDASLFHALNGFDASYPENFGDTTFCLRALEAGAKICYEPEASAIHYESATRGHNEKANKEGFDLYKAEWVRTGRVQKLLKDKGFVA